MSRHITRRVGTLGLMVALGLASLTPQSHGAPPTASMQNIVEAWKHREEQTRTLVFEFQEALFLPKGAHSAQMVVSRKPLSTRQVRYPAEDTTYEYSYVLKIDGQKVRYEYRGPRPIHDIGEFLPTWNLSVNDGQVFKQFLGMPADRPLLPRGFISEPSIKRQGTAQILYIHPIVMCYRPFTMRASDDSDPSKYSIRPGLAVVGQHHCVMLTATSNDFKDVLWVDPGCEFVPVRWQNIVQGSLRIQADIEYARDVSHGWVPCGWKISTYLPPDGAHAVGKLVEQVNAQRNQV